MRTRARFSLKFTVAENLSYSICQAFLRGFFVAKEREREGGGGGGREFLGA